MRPILRAGRGGVGGGGGGGVGGVTVNIHALGRDPPCPCHTATPKRYLLSARVTTASSASFRENIFKIPRYPWYKEL